MDVPQPQPQTQPQGSTDEAVHSSVQNYYGNVLQSTKDLKSNACCTSERVPQEVRDAISHIHPEVLDKYYGCGIVSPPLLKGLTILDLGCGAGRDCYILSQFVGAEGHVIGVDMTQSMLDVGIKHTKYHTEKCGLSNLQFRLGTIENLAEAGILDASVDIVVSNCVVNLAPNKDAVLREVYRVLKPGGEMYFSDVYASQRMPKHLISNPVLYGECLSGALYWNDFLHLARSAGFADPRLVKDSRISITAPAIKDLVGSIEFYSATYRLFKIAGLEPDCEDYGQAVRYRGTIPNFPNDFTLDAHHVFTTGKVSLVCRNTYLMLEQTRFRPHFDFIDGNGEHFGIFDGCGKNIPFQSAKATSGSASSKSSSGCC